MPAEDPDVPLCPACGLIATAHPPGPCLDRWVHGAFLQQQANPDSQVPAYSAVPQQRCLDTVINAPRWPESFAVFQTSQGCTVGRRVRQSTESVYFHTVASASDLPVAVCRAAACAASEAGDRPLRIV